MRKVSINGGWIDHEKGIHVFAKARLKTQEQHPGRGWEVWVPSLGWGKIRWAVWMSPERHFEF